MTARKSTFILLLTIVAASLTITGCSRERERTASHSRPSLDGVRSGREVPVRTRVPRPYGKLRVPAALFVDLVQPEPAGAPVGIIVSASSDIVASSGVITLRVPEIGGAPGRTEVLWAGGPSDFIAEAQEYAVPPLPVGRYHFVAILEFTPDRLNAEKLVLSESLYVDVRADRILSFNVSFRQLERQELYRELEQRVLESINPGLAAADPETMARYRELMETANPGLIKSKIAELRATDPDVARQIMELNSTKAETEPGRTAAN